MGDSKSEIIFQDCKVCGESTSTIFNINLKATPICEGCAVKIFLQQAQWYAKEVLPSKVLKMDKELDLVHACLTELYEIDKAAPIIKKCLDKIEKLQKKK